MAHYSSEYASSYGRRSPVVRKIVVMPSEGPDRRAAADMSAIASLESMVNMCSMPPELPPMTSVTDPSHSFLIQAFQYDSAAPREPQPANPREYADRIDGDHLLMPCSPTIKFTNGQPVWPFIKDALRQLQQKCLQRQADFQDLEKTITICVGGRLDLLCLEHVIKKVLQPRERSEFLFKTLHDMCELAISVDAICRKAPRLLRSGRSGSLTMSQKQAASLLACAFFCLFPGLTDSRVLRDFQDPNFARLYRRGPPCNIGKIQCILNYFRRVAEYMPRGVITFSRFVLPPTEIPQWSKSMHRMVPVHITASKKIEEVPNTLQVDFANEMIGGGVLSGGCVQEEIRFTICPEMIVSLMICEVMRPNECIHLIGCEQYSRYEGYGESFRYAGNYLDSSRRDSWGRKFSHVVAIDALYFPDPSVQYQEKYLDRELTKAYAGYYSKDASFKRSFPVTTGHWGCGAFNGDRQFKALIQLMAVAQADRPMVFAAYLDQRFFYDFSQLYNHFIREQMTVGDLYRYLRAYCRSSKKEPVFSFILHTPKSSLRS